MLYNNTVKSYSVDDGALAFCIIFLQIFFSKRPFFYVKEVSVPKLSRVYHFRHAIAIYSLLACYYVGVNEPVFINPLCLMS